MVLTDVLNGLATAAGLVNPAVAGGIKLVNAFLPADKKLAPESTGADVLAAYNGLPSDQRSSIDAQAEIELAHLVHGHDTLQTMLQSDARNPHSTRPKIVLGCFWVLTISTMLIIFMWAYAVIVRDDLLVTAIMNGWPMIIALLAPFATVLVSYFGNLVKEQANKYAAASGQAAPMLGIA